MQWFTHLPNLCILISHCLQLRFFLKKLKLQRCIWVTTNFCSYTCNCLVYCFLKYILVIFWLHSLLLHLWNKPQWCDVSYQTTILCLFCSFWGNPEPFYFCFCSIAFALPGLKTNFCLSSHLTASFNFPHLILFLISPLCWGRELYPDSLCAINVYTILNNLTILFIVFTSDYYTILLAKDKWLYIYLKIGVVLEKNIMNWNGNIISS